LKDILPEALGIKLLETILYAAHQIPRGVGFISVEYFIPILKDISTVEFTGNQ
jgi:hypothetical protein